MQVGYALESYDAKAFSARHVSHSEGGQNMSNINRPASSLGIANEFIRRAYAHDRSITPMQVQKLVYFAHGMSLATLHQPLVADVFEAWRFGPVARPLYDALRQYGGTSILRLIEYGDGSPFSAEPGEEPVVASANPAPAQVRLINRIDTRFGGLPAFRLSALTHEAGSPWANVYRDGVGQNNPIPNEALGDYFSRLTVSKAEHVGADA